MTASKNTGRGRGIGGGRGVLPKHGKTGTKLHRLWIAMRQRCNDENFHAYPRYGGRGIYVDSRWDDFEQFAKDMGEPPPGMSLDRRDNDGPYSPENCRWATCKQQSQNRVSTVFIEHCGERLCIADWAAKFGVRRSTLHNWIKSKGAEGAMKYAESYTENKITYLKK